MTLTAGQSRRRLLGFVVVAALVLITIYATLRPIGWHQNRVEYVADFTSASHLRTGQTVRVAGVEVGQVTGVELTDRDLARVHFSVDADVPVQTTSTVQIRYLDLAGNRYVAVAPGEATGPAQPRGQVIDTARTKPALDINDLLNGFKPLLRGLSPADLNALSLQIVQTLQGDGGTVQQLMSHTASLTQGLAARTELIGQVITNLDGAVGLFADRHTELEQLIGALRNFTDGLAADRVSIGEAITHIDDMTNVTAGLIAASRPPLQADVASLGAVAHTLASPFGHSQLDQAFNVLPDKLARLSATASYGSWFNYYVCGVRVKVSAAAQAADPFLASLLGQIHLVDSASRCNP